MDYRELGRIAKGRYPGVYDHYDDDRVGRAYADEHGITDLPSAEIALTPDEIAQFATPTTTRTAISVDSNEHFFLGTRTKHLEKQIAYLNMQYAKDHAERQAEFDHAHFDEKMVQKYYQEKAQYILSVLTTRLQAQDALIAQELGAVARSKGLDRSIYLIQLLRQFDTDERLREREAQFKQDQQHKEAQAKIEREDKVRTAEEQIRITTAAALATRQQIIFLREQLMAAIARKGTVAGNPELLQVVLEDIASLRRQIERLEQDPKDDRPPDSRQESGRHA